MITCAAPNLRERPSNSMNPHGGSTRVKISDAGLQALRNIHLIENGKKSFYRKDVRLKDATVYLELRPMTAEFLLRRFDDLDRLRDLGCRIAYPHARRKNEEHIAYEEQTRNLYISGLDLVCGLIANIGETEQKDMKKIQKAVKKDFENYSEQYKESFLNCIMDFINPTHTRRRYSASYLD